jgi:hypothetical protein
MEYRTEMTEADYERALQLLQIAEKDLAEYVVSFGGDRLVSVAHALSDALRILGVELLEVNNVRTA